MTQAISPLRQRMIDDMRMRKFSPKTRDAYIRAVQRFSPTTLTSRSIFSTADVENSSSANTARYAGKGVTCNATESPHRLAPVLTAGW